MFKQRHGSDCTVAQSDARLNPASTLCGTTISQAENVIQMLLCWLAERGPLFRCFNLKVGKPMPTQDSDQTVQWIKLRTVDNKF